MAWDVIASKVDTYQKFKKETNNVPIESHYANFATTTKNDT